MSRQIFLDTETTGLNAEAGDRVIEIGCVEMVARRLTGNNRHYYLNPERANHEDAVKIHGLTDEFLADKPLFAAVADDLLDFLAGAEIIIHNAAFDVAFMDEELRRIGRGRFHEHVGSVTDSLQMARSLYPGKSNSLDALCRRLEVDNSNRTLHGALLDAGLLAEVYIQMTRGQESLVIDAEDPGERAAAAGSPRVNLAGLTLPVVSPSSEELAAHQALLEDLDKASKGATLWRQMQAAL